MRTALELKDILKIKRAGCFSHLNGEFLNRGKNKAKTTLLDQGIESTRKFNWI